MKWQRILSILVALYYFSYVLSCRAITCEVDEMFGKGTHNGCFDREIIAGQCVQLDSISRLGSGSIYELIDIHNVDIHRDMVAP